jgi:hypothetical protein
MLTALSALLVLKNKPSTNGIYTDIQQNSTVGEMREMICREKRMNLLERITCTSMLLCLSLIKVSYAKMQIALQTEWRDRV